MLERGEDKETVKKIGIEIEREEEREGERERMCKIERKKTMKH